MFTCPTHARRANINRHSCCYSLYTVATNKNRASAALSYLLLYTLYYNRSSPKYRKIHLFLLRWQLMRYLPVTTEVTTLFVYLFSMRYHHSVLLRSTAKYFFAIYQKHLNKSQLSYIILLSVYNGNKKNNDLRPQTILLHKTLLGVKDNVRDIFRKASYCPRTEGF